MVQKKGGAVGSMEIYPFAVRVANALVSYVKYLGKMIWPAKLAVFYPHSGMLPVWQVIGAGVLLGLITFIAIRSFRQRPWFIVGWLWFIGTLVPVIGLVQIGLQAMADRYTYIPLIGVFIIVAWGVPELLHRWRHKEKLLGLTAISVIIMLGITSWVQTRYWKNTVLLFNHTIEVTDNNYVMHNNLGFALTARGRPDEAIKHYKEALRLNPDYEPANINLGLALLSQGKFDECIDYYQEVLRVNPGYARVHNNLGAVLWRLGKIEKATVHFRKAVLLKPDYAEAHNSLGAALIFKGEIEKAIAHLQKALRLNPDYALAKINLGKALAAQKKISDADTETPDT
jgi:tetratricopeptide (TPR) repeat protein